LRKQIFVALSIFILLSFTVLAYAEEPQIKLGGDILVRGWYFKNVDQSLGTYLPVDTAAQSFYTTEARLTVDAKISDNLKGFMELETRTLGDPFSGEYVWGTSTYNEKPPADLAFRQLWIQYTGSGILGVPSGIKIGHMVWGLGEEQFFNHERFGDDGIMLFTQPTKELLLAALTAKLGEGYPLYGNSHDLDAYAVAGDYKLDKDNTVGMYYWYGNKSDIDLKITNLGFHAHGLLAQALTYAAEADFQFGNATPFGTKLHFGGYGFMAKAGYKIDPVNLRASFAFGSGDSNGASDGKVSEFQVTNDSDSQSPATRFVHYTQIYERTVTTAAMNQYLGQGGNPFGVAPDRGTGIANTIYYNLGADLMVVKDLGLSLDGFLLRAQKVPAGVNKSIGAEVDFKGSYKIAKNLTYFVEAGVFDPSKFYSSYYGIDKKTVTQFVHGLDLTF
jgi:hypothetical protein